MWNTIMRAGAALVASAGLIGCTVIDIEITGGEDDGYGWTTSDDTDGAWTSTTLIDVSTTSPATGYESGYTTSEEFDTEHLPCPNTTFPPGETTLEPPYTSGYDPSGDTEVTTTPYTTGGDTEGPVTTTPYTTDAPPDETGGDDTTEGGETYTGESEGGDTEGGPTGEPAENE